MRRYETSTIWAPLAEIRMSERSARSLSAATVEQYRGWLEDGRETPPIRIARVGDAYVVRDGRHRVAAALAAGYRFIEAEVRPIGRLLNRLSSIASGWRHSCRHPATGTRFFRKNTSLAPRRSGFDSRRLHWTGLRSVNGKHAPFVRPRCGFDSCRRLCFTAHARSSVDSSAALRGRRTLVRIQPSVSRAFSDASGGGAGLRPAGAARSEDAPCGRSSQGKAPGRQPGGARSIRVVRSRRLVV